MSRTAGVGRTKYGAIRLLWSYRINSANFLSHTETNYFHEHESVLSSSSTFPTLFLHQ